MSRVSHANMLHGEHDDERDGLMAFLKTLRDIWDEYNARCDEAKECGLPPPDMDDIHEEEYDAGWIASEHYERIITMIERERAAANHEGDQ